MFEKFEKPHIYYTIYFWDDISRPEALVFYLSNNVIGITASLLFSEQRQ